MPLIDCLTSFFSGFVIFTVLGAMAKAKGVEVADVATGGINVYSIVYLFKFPTQILRPQEQFFFTSDPMIPYLTQNWHSSCDCTANEC